jgi:alpha-tubulin suppressor-like RCC1 family protein
MGIYNYGQLGDGTNVNKTIPAQINDISNVVGIAAGSSHTLALKSNCSAWDGDIIITVKLGIKQPQINILR